VEPPETILSNIGSLAKLYPIRDVKDMSWLKNVNPLSDLVILDGYHFDTDYQMFIKQLGIKLIVIDDNADIYYHADLIINHGSSTIVTKYRKKEFTKVLTGFDYLILRKAFLNAAKKTRHIANIDSALICMGGADPKNLTQKYLDAVLKSGLFSEINVVVGGANNMKLVNVYQECSNVSVAIHHNVNAVYLIDLIMRSHIVVSPASTMSLEVCCVKAGLLTGTIVDNQENILKQLIDYKCCRSIGDLELATEETIITELNELADVALINKMMKNQKASIDGNSANRVRKSIKELLN
jgi:spore coat polysaccharide biosynthesis predicted glycosyltransferase SpsG